MSDGVAIFEVVEVAIEIDAGAGFGVFEEAGDLEIGVFLFVGGDDNFNAVAGGEDEGFLNATGSAKVFEGFGEGGRVESKALAHFDWRGPVIEACDVDLHLLSEERPEADMGDPGECTEQQHVEGEEGGAATAPAGVGAQVDDS